MPTTYPNISNISWGHLQYCKCYRRPSGLALPVHKKGGLPPFSCTAKASMCKKLRKTSPRCRARTSHRVGCRAPQQANIILLTQPPYAGHAGRTSLFLKTIRLHSSKSIFQLHTIQLENGAESQNNEVHK